MGLTVSWYKKVTNTEFLLVLKFYNQFSSVAQSCLTLWNPINCSIAASLSITNSQSLPKSISIESVMPSNHLIHCHHLLLSPLIFPSIRVFSNESVLCIRWPKFWNFSFNFSPSNEHPGLISFRMDWLDLLEVQGTLKSLLQHHSSKASILRRSAFFINQISYPYMPYTTFCPHFNFLAIQKICILYFLEVGCLFVWFFFEVGCVCVCVCVFFFFPLIPFQTTCSVFPFVHSLDIIAPLILLLIIQVYSF